VSPAAPCTGSRPSLLEGHHPPGTHFSKTESFQISQISIPPKRMKATPQP
jgi:hypothetical protein